MLTYPSIAVRKMDRKILRTIKVDSKEWERFGELANALASDRSELLRRAIKAMLKDRKLLDKIIKLGGDCQGG